MAPKFLFFEDTGNLPIVVGGGGTASAPLISSFDGITFTATSVTKPSGILGFASNGEVWVAIGNGFGFSSTDGIVWSSLVIPAGFWRNVKWNGSVFCAVGGSTGKNTITSSDGITWSENVNVVPTSFGNNTSYGGTFVSVGNYHFVGFDLFVDVALSIDGVSWSTSSLLIPSHHSPATGKDFGSGRPIGGATATENLFHAAFYYHISGGAFVDYHVGFQDESPFEFSASGSSDFFPMSQGIYGDGKYVIYGSGVLQTGDSGGFTPRTAPVFNGTISSGVSGVQQSIAYSPTLGLFFIKDSLNGIWTKADPAAAGAWTLRTAATNGGIIATLD